MILEQTKGFVQSQLNYIEPEVYTTKYASIQYPMLMPVDTMAPDWTRGITRYTSDGTGRPRFIGAAGRDVPRVSLRRAQIDRVVEMAALGYDWTLDELQTAMMLGQSLDAEKARVCRFEAEKEIDRIALYGDETLQWDGLINMTDDAIVRYDADQNAAANARSWDNKDSDEIKKDIDRALSGVYVDTLQVERADTVALPVEAWDLLVEKRIPHTDTPLMRYFMENNIYTMETGLPLRIRTIRGLETAGTGSVVPGHGRMIAYCNRSDVLRLHLPMPYRFLPMYQQSSMAWVVDGIFRIGGLEVRLPKCFRYVDGILSP